TRIFVDGNLGDEEAVARGLVDLRKVVPETVEHNYVYAGSYVLAAFGANAIGRLSEAAELIVHGGGGDHLPRLQLVDRVYGYELLVEDALARGDGAAALLWAERAASLPVERHHMASAALGRIRARVAVSQSDNAAGIRESSDSGTLAALVGGDLEVTRARIIEASARAGSGDRIRGIEELEEAARRANSGGASAVRDWAERELAAHGRRLRNVPGHGWDALTPTQKVIARLAASGLRNREIAAALFVSEKTVESHVAAVLGALGTTNRVGIGRELGGDEVDPVFGSKVTPRQREVAVLVAQGLSNSAISRSLSISEKTVEKHVADLFDRLEVRTRSALAACVRGVPASSDS
ncbi:MAG: LuxR family transcriptional regulator, partial [Aeromicrobium sp.]|nr:LuxR family transcriptional regulator [Aeromicrobium sp.]